MYNILLKSLDIIFVGFGIGFANNRSNEKERIDHPKTSSYHLNGLVALHIVRGALFPGGLPGSPRPGRVR